MSDRARAGISAWGSLLAASSWAIAAGLTGIVPNDWPAECAAPVVVPLPARPPAPGRCMIELKIAEQSEATLLPAQTEPADSAGRTPARAWFFWSAKESDRGKRAAVRFLPFVPLRPNSADFPDSAYRSGHDDPMLHITTAENKPILSYWHGPPSSGQRYPLNDFIHRLIGLDGEILTACSPADHVHHRGVFWAWVRHERRGQSLGDWWAPRNIHAEPGALEYHDGPVFTRFVARHFWVHQPQGAERGDRFVEEQVICRVFKTTADGRALDIDLTLTALDDGVGIGGTLSQNKGYGGMTIRFGRAKGVKLETDQGAVEEETVNHLRALWVDWSGRFVGPDGKDLPHRSGAALLVNLAHPDLPPEWITRKYGPINVSYPGLNMLEIGQNRPLQLRYRIWIHRGDAKGGKVNAYYRAYAADWKWTAGHR